MSRAALWLTILVSLLFSIGLLMVFNTTSAEIIDRSLDVSTHGALFKQIVYGVIGLFLGLLFYSLGHQWFLRWSTVLLTIGTLLLIMVFVPSIGQSINGAKRWIGFAGLTIQPSECVKILIPIAFIRWVFTQPEPIQFKPFLKMLGFLSIPIGLILLEPDNGTTAIIFACLVVLFFLSRISWRYWALPLMMLMLIGGIAASRMPHVHDRLNIYFHPESDIKGKGHQPYQAKIAAGSGQFLGLGWGESLQKLNYLPEARNDYIAAIYAEECGFVGVLALIVLYASLAFVGFYIAFSSQDRGSFLMASILTFLIAIQAFLNLGIVSGLLPSKGMTLPFFSQGGSSLIMNIIAFFLLLDISRSARQVKN